MTENLPALADAKLPATYEAAKTALATCVRVDEAKGWADKAQALASYARQAKDDTLLRLAQRIQLRAASRMGELLKLVPRADGATRFGQDGAVPPVTRTQMASDAGLSERQRKTALRVANVPRDEFETALEGPRPPTVAQMAARGTVPRPPVTNAKSTPADPAQVAKAAALLRDFAAFAGATDPRRVARGQDDADRMRGYVATLDSWLDRFVTNLPSGGA